MKQKVVVVTGGGRGIGRACALRQARAGDFVYVWDRDERTATRVANQIAEFGGAAEARTIDIADTVQVRDAIQQVRSYRGRLDGLVHAAAVFRTIPLCDMDESEYDWLMRVNLRAAVFITKAAAEAMTRGGAIVLFASVAGQRPRPLAAHYAASKAAIINFAGSAALAYGPDVRVNAVCPGVIATEMTEQLASERRELPGIKVDDPYPAFAETLALKRLGQPEDVAMVVDFLLGPLSGYVTGQALNVDGGFSGGPML